MDDIVTTLEAPSTLNLGTDVRQFQLGMGIHDGTQYNFFCEDKFFSVRVIESRKLNHQSAWVYDGGVVELLNTNEPWERLGASHMNIKSSRFHVEADDNGGVVSVLAEDKTPVLQLKFTTPVAATWACPDGCGLHQPLIAGEVIYDGKTYTGVGYCKRYWLEEDIGYLSWRFIEGEVDNGRYMLWTAAATFGHQKYDYFKIAHPDGTIVAADNQTCRHRDEGAIGVIDGTTYQVQLEEIGTWQTVLAAEGTDIKLRQRFCKLKVLHEGQVDTGYTLNETGIGAIY